MARLFVALIPPAEVVKPLLGAVGYLRAEHPRLAAGMRWTPSESWHITLAFLGEVPATVRPELTRTLADVARRHPPAPVTIAGGGCFGTRVLFACVGEEPLAPLAAAVARESRRAGTPGPDDARPWRGHLTLATRGLSPTGRGHGTSPPAHTAAGDLTPLVDALAEVSCRPWTAAEFALMRSAGPGRRYEPAATWTLSGTPGHRT